MEKNTHRTWAEISLKTIEHNYNSIKKHVGDTDILCVIKANAYGHGSGPVALHLQNIGAAYFGVATVPEAVELRMQGINKPILILGYVDEADAPLVARYGITAAVYDFDTAQMLSKAAIYEDKDIDVHIKIDTGMTRLGFSTVDVDNAVSEILKCTKLKGLNPTGIFTHFAVADEQDGSEYTQNQLAKFIAINEKLKQNGLDLKLKHCANSGGVIDYKSSHMSMVRAGIILYGYYPDGRDRDIMDLRPALTLKAHVVQVQNVKKDTLVSYGGTFKTTEDCKLTVLSIGYADGFLRSGSENACVLINNVKVPIVGRICMDMCMAQIPDDLDVKRGDEVTIYGNHTVTANTAAKAANTIVYEVLCAVSSRVPRMYID